MGSAADRLKAAREKENNTSAVRRLAAAQEKVKNEQTVQKQQESRKAVLQKNMTTGAPTASEKEKAVVGGSFGGGSTTKKLGGFTGERKREQTVTERAAKTLEGAAAGYLGNMASAAGAGVQMSSRNPADRAVELLMQAVNDDKANSDLILAARMGEQERAQRKADTGDALRTLGRDLSGYGQGQIETAKEDLGFAGKLLVDAGVGGAQMAADIGLGALTGLGMEGVMALRGFGGGVEQAAADGADLTGQLRKGMGSAGVAYATERLFGAAFAGLKAVKPGIADDFLEQGIGAMARKLTNSPQGIKALETIGNLGVSFGGEFSEEFIEGFLDPYVTRLAYDPNAETVFQNPELLGDYLYEGLIGGILGGIGGGVNLAAQSMAGTQEEKQESIALLPPAQAASGQESGPLESTVTTREVSEDSFIPKTRADSETSADPLADVQQKAVQSAYEAGRANVPMEQMGQMEQAQEEAYLAGRKEALRDTALKDAKNTLGDQGYTAFEENFAEDAAYADLTRAYNDGLAGARHESGLSADKYSAMYEAGRADAKASVQAQTEMVGNAAAYKADSGIDYADADTKAYVETSVDRKTAKTINAVARALGIKVRFADSVAGGDANAEIENGIVTIEKGNKNPVRFLFGHEITHRMQELAPAEYARLREAVATGGWIDAAVKEIQSNYNRHGRSISSEAAMDEAVADYVGSLLEDSGELERFISKHRDDRTLLEKLRDVIRELVQKLRGTEQHKRLLEVEQRLSETLDAAVKVVENRSEQDYTGANDTRYSMKEDSDNDQKRIGRDGSTADEGPHARGGQAVQRAAGETSGRGRFWLSARRGVRASFGEKPKSTWAKRGVIEPENGSVAQSEQQIAMSYGVPSFVISDKVWTDNEKNAPAFSLGGQIYFRATLPEAKRGMIAAHELTHVMQQVGFKPYLDFVKRTPDMLNLSSNAARALLDRTAKHRGIDLMAMDDVQQMKLYDEFNAAVYSYIAADKIGNLNKVFYEAFRDFDSYSRELTELHQQFKESRTGGKTSYSLKGSEQLGREIERIMKDGKRHKRSEAEIQADIRAAVDEVYQGMLTDYGAIDPGEKPFRDVQVPRKTADDKKVSQTVRTILEAQATPEEAIPNIQQMVATGDFSYDVYTDKQAIADAEGSIRKAGWAQSLSDWMDRMKKGEVSKELTTKGWALYNNAANSDDTETALTILDYMVKHQRNAAQALQATRILKKLSPETQLYQIRRSVDGLQEELNQRYGEKNGPELQINRDLAEQYMKAQTEEERDEIMKDIYRDIGKQMPARFADKWNAWRYLAMLGNLRTHVRNVFGNLGFAPVVGVKNMTAAAIESAVSRVSGGKLERTKGVVGLSKADRGLLSAAWKDYAIVDEAAMSGGKYDDFAHANKYIEEGRVIFKNKALEAARKGNSKALEAEDRWFSQPHYAAALAGYCKTHGITAEQIAGGKGLKNARAYALKEAQKATYRDTNSLSQTISELGRVRKDEKNPVKKGMGMVMEGILPFRKTPANILARGLEYSPVGLMNGIKQALFDVKNKKKTGAEAIDSISAGLTGTGLLALGVYMAAQGLVRGHGSGDEKEKEYEELMGHQAYALELPDGTSVTLDWLAPEVLPFFIGVNLWEQTEGEAEELTLSAMLNAVKTVSEPLLEMSCLQSLNDVFDSVGYAASEGLDGLPAALASAATSYLTQGLPTILGQAERTGEGQRMTTYTEKNAFLTGDMQYTLGKASARLPGWDYQQIPYIDAWGRTESSGGVGERAFSNFLNPAYTSAVDASGMEKELLRLYEATGEGGVLPSRAAKYINVDNERKDLTGEEYVKYATKKGQTAYDLMAGLTKSSAYKAMSDTEKVEAVKKVYEYANAVGKAAVSSYKPDGWVAKAIKTSKATGVKAEQYVTLYLAQKSIESLKDADGETIDNSKSLLIMQMLYNTKGLTDKQRAALFEDFGVGKKVQHYNRALVDQKLDAMKK